MSDDTYCISDMNFKLAADVEISNFLHSLYLTTRIKKKETQSYT